MSQTRSAGERHNGLNDCTKDPRKKKLHILLGWPPWRTHSCVALFRNHSLSRVSRRWFNYLNSKLFSSSDDESDLLLPVALFVIFGAFINILPAMFE